MPLRLFGRNQACGYDQEATRPARWPHAVALHQHGCEEGAPQRQAGEYDLRLRCWHLALTLHLCQCPSLTHPHSCAPFSGCTAATSAGTLAEVTADLIQDKGHVLACPVRDLIGEFAVSHALRLTIQSLHLEKSIDRSICYRSSL